MKTVFSGIQPAWVLYLGCYVDAVRDRMTLQDQDRGDPQGGRGRERQMVTERARGAEDFWRSR